MLFYITFKVKCLRNVGGLYINESTRSALTEKEGIESNNMQFMGKDDENMRFLMKMPS
ncbi:unknown protein [Paenibacillus amylolyticus]|uniref:Uncharacterized protein n=1 Tax=Paenibacillus amylolyticus TaxID=1451 RepID=A0A117I087_PAEAM|nr:unknown protein [Paenibacillus amylolyticus]